MSPRLSSSSIPVEAAGRVELVEVAVREEEVDLDELEVDEALSE